MIKRDLRMLLRSYNSDGIIEAETLALMAVTIATLGELLATKFTGEGAETLMSAYVVLHITKLGKRLATGQTLKHLVLTPSLFVQMLRFSKTKNFSFTFRDDSLVYHLILLFWTIYRARSLITV